MRSSEFFLFDNGMNPKDVKKPEHIARKHYCTLFYKDDAKNKELKHMEVYIPKTESDADVPGFWADVGENKKEKINIEYQREQSSLGKKDENSTDAPILFFKSNAGANQYLEFEGRKFLPS